MIRETSIQQIKSILAAVFGQKGHKQSDLPKEMLVGDAALKNLCIQVFGWGAWLVDNPLEGLEPLLSTLRANMVRTPPLCVTLSLVLTENFASQDKALYWQMARRFTGAYVVIRDDLPIGKCTNANNAFDTDKGRCLDVLTYYPKTRKGRIGGSEAIETAWSKWGMDKLATLRNTVSCWENNDASVGRADSSLGSWSSQTPPPCFFGMPVLKGNWTLDNTGTIWLAGDFVGQENQAGKLWPQSKCSDLNRAELSFNPYFKVHTCADFDLDNGKGGLN